MRVSTSNIYMRFPEGRARALTLSYDDGVEQDVKLIDMMNQYGLKGTFNLNSGLYNQGETYAAGAIHRRMTEKQVTDTYLSSGHEIAVHSLTHPFLEKLPVHLAVQEIIKDRENLEKQFDTIVRGMAYPFGTFSDTLVEALRACGIVYARTVNTTNDFRIPGDWLRLTATCHHNSPLLQELADKFLQDRVPYGPYLFYLWGHSYEFEANNNWDVMEDFAKKVGNREDIWYATNIEIYEYIEAYRRLVFSVNGYRIHNPSHQTIWLVHSGQMVVLQPGETIVL